MLFALTLGAVLAFVPLDWPFTLALLAVGLVGKGMVDVRCNTMPLTQKPSPFLHYCKNLMERDEEISHAPFSYILQLVVFGLIAGGGLMMLVRALH